MSGRLCCSLALLSVLLTPSHTCGENQYSWIMDGKPHCCSKCPPGKYLINRCTRSKLESECGSCISGTFSEIWNIYESCPSCGTCLEANGVQIEKDCTAKSQVKCTCRPGYALNTAPPTAVEKCFKICNEGEQVKQEDFNACEPCPHGFYSNKKGTKSCEEWTRCTDDQRFLIKNGSRTGDTVCSSSEPRQTTTSKGRPPAIETTSSTTLLTMTTTHPTSATTAGKASLPKDNVLFICVIVVTALLLIIVIFRRIMSCKDGNRGFRCCFGDRNYPKAPIPVQEEFNDITSVQVKN